MTSAAPLILDAPTERMTPADRLVSVMEQPHRYTSSQILQFGLYPSHIILLEEFQTQLLAGSLRPTLPGQMLVPFELLADEMMKYIWVGNEVGFVHPNMHIQLPTRPTLNIFLPPGMNTQQDLSWHQYSVSQAASSISEWIRDLDRSLGLILLESGYRDDYVKPFSPDSLALRHDAGKVSRAYGVLVDRRPPRNLTELDALKLAHTLIGASIVDFSVMSDGGVMTGEFEHFVMQLTHHWFFKQYPQFNKLPKFSIFQQFLPFIEEQAKILTSASSDVKLSELLENVIRSRDIYKIYAFMAVVKSAVTSIADEYIARTEIRPYKDQRPEQIMTPEKARQEVATMIYKNKLPWPFLEAFLQITKSVVSLDQTMELVREYAA